MPSRPRVVVATPHPIEGSAAADWLRAEGFEPVKVTTIARATQELTERPFDLLVADVEFAFRGGLQVLSRERARNVKAPCVVIGPADAATEALAVKRDAMYLSRPLDHAALVCMAHMAVLESRPERRSVRKPVNRFDAVVSGVPAHIIDVSNEGMRLEIPRSRKAAPPPPVFMVRVGLLGVNVTQESSLAPFSTVKQNLQQRAERVGYAFPTTAIREQRDKIEPFLEQSQTNIQALDAYLTPENQAKHAIVKVEKKQHPASHDPSLEITFQNKEKANTQTKVYAENSSQNSINFSAAKGLPSDDFSFIAKQIAEVAVAMAKPGAEFDLSLAPDSKRTILVYAFDAAIQKAMKDDPNRFNPNNKPQIIIVTHSETTLGPPRRL